MKLVVPFILLAAFLVGAVLIDRPLPPAGLTFVNRGEVHTLDPQRMSWLQDFRICYNIYEGLVVSDNDTFEILPGVAESWELSDDKLTYTFHLRPNARWSNGEPVTAHDFVYSWQRALMPDTAADYTDLFYRLRGGEAFFNWRVEQLERYASSERDELPESEWQDAALELREQANRHFQETVGVHAIDDRTLIVELEGPTPYMLDLLAFGPFCPVYPPLVESYVEIDPVSGAVRQQHGWTKPPHHVGNGPYNLTLWRYMRDMRLERNPYYWDPDRARSDSIVAVTIEEPSTAVLAFETGAIDWLSTVDTDYTADMLDELNRYLTRNAPRLEELRAGGMRDYDDLLATIIRESPPQAGERANIHAFPAFGTYFYNFNCNLRLNSGAPNPFFDPQVRRAFSMAVNKQALVEKVTRQNQPVATTLIPPGSIPGYNSPEGLPYDPARACAELAAAGWIDRDGDPGLENERGDPFPEVEILFTTNGPHERPAEAIASMWEQTLGVRTRLVAKESKTFGDDLKNQNFMVSRAGWYGDYGDPTTFLDLCRTNNGNNDRNFSSPYFDDIMAEADRELDPVKRMRILEEAERFIVDEQLPLLPLFQYVTVYMYDPSKLENMSQHPRLTQYLWEMKVND